jgi:hypothetical protein
MAAASTKYNASFLTALGDNFYTVGVASDTDPLWQSAYRNVCIVSNTLSHIHKCRLFSFVEYVGDVEL